MARRVNTKFLMILTVLVVGLGMAALLARKFLFRESPEKYVVYGQQMMSEHKYEEAVKNFAHAVALDQKNPSLWVAYGDAMNQLSPNDVEYMIRARKAWENALTVDVNNKPALDRMMQFWSDVANMDSSRPEVFEGLHDTAVRLYNADKNNAAAEIATVTSVIRPWLGGVEKDPKEIQANISKLIELMKKYPENPDLPMFAAQAKLRLADRERQRDRTKDADALVGEAVKIVDAALARTPSAAMWFSAAQVYQAQESIDPRGAAQWRDKKREAYAKARAQVKPEDPLYVHIHINAARAVIDKKDESEKILRELMKNQPDDQQVRLALAEQLALTKETRDEAVKILELPFAQKNLIGPKAYMVRELQIRTLSTLTNLRIEAYIAAKEEERKKLLPAIEDGLSKIVQKDGDGPRSLRLRGKLLRSQGQTVEAIQTLERARQLAEKNGSLELQGDRLERWEVVDLLAKAYIDTQQTGRAKDLLTELVNRFPAYDPARMLLAQLLVRDGAFDDARPHVEYFKRKSPDDPDVIKISLQVMDPKTANKDKDKEKERLQQIKETYAKLPERNKAEMLDKVNAAMVLDQHEDAVRLLNKVQKDNPGDFDVARMAVRMYRTLGELDAARAAVDVAVKANPTDEKLQLLKRQVADLTPEGLMKIRREEIAKNPDAFAREVGFADCDRRENKLDEALKHLQAAQRLKPDNGDVTALIFNIYVMQKQWANAEALIVPLAKANQDQTNGLLFRYRLAMAKQDYATALNYGKSLVQRMGEFGQSWLAVGQALQALGQNEEALKNYLAALEKQSDSAEAFRGSIECYYALNRPTEARRKITDARRALPGNAYFLEMEIHHELTYGDPANAVGPREDMARKNPDRQGPLMALGQAYLAAARYNAGKPDRADQTSKMYAKARETFRQGLTKWPDEIAFYAYYAETGARSGDLGDTEAVLKQVAARDAWKGKIEPQLLLAEYYGITRRFPEAEAALRNVMAQQPKNVDVQVRMANLLVNQSKPDEALKILEVNATDPKITRRRVEILLTTQRLDEAEKALDEILAKTPDNLEIIHIASSVAINRQKYDKAQQLLDKAVSLDATNATTEYFVGLLTLNRPGSNIADAIAHLQKGKDSANMGLDARVALAECYRRRSDFDGSIRELEGALQSQPTNRRVRLALLDAYTNLQPPRWVDADRVIREAKTLPGYKGDVEILQREATMWASRNEPKLAVERINDALALNPNDMALMRVALNLLVKAGRYGDVNTRVEQLVAKDPTLWWAYQARAISKRWQDRKDEALKDFEAAITAANTAKNDDAVREIVGTMGDVIGPDEAILRITKRASEPDGDRWNIMIARLQQTKGDNAAAVKTVEQVLAREEQLPGPDKENLYRFAGTLYLIVNQPDKSFNCYKKLLALAPDDMTALNNTACLLAEVIQPPRPQEGLEYSKHAYDLMKRGGRRDPLVLDTHGWLLTLSGQVDAGIDVLRSVNDIKQIPDAHYHLGEAYLRKQFADEAQRELDMALDLFKRMVQDKQPVDMSLQAKIEGAMARAGMMARQKKTTANAPAGPNVP
jgi:tetratricopeptide (TPR) repeat protein